MCIPFNAVYNMKKYLPWIFRILIFVLFIFSGISKMVPLWSFEKQLVDLGICSWCSSHFLARAIIALELALGFAILQSHYVRRIVIPATILLLVAFCVHLSIQMALFGNSGNCGCFGQLIEMTPLEALIKNIVTIGMLVYLWFTVKDREHSYIVYPALILLVCTLFMFVAFPFCPCEKEKKPLDEMVTQDIVPIASPEEVTIKADSVLPERKDTVIKTGKTPDTLQGKNEKAVEPVAAGPTKTTSKFASYRSFGGKKFNADEGKKIVCMFAPGCDHCRATAKTLCALSARPGFPELAIFFMDEEANLIPEFFKEAGCHYPYQVLSIPQFWDLMGSGATTPAVFCLWNGNVVKSFEGIEKNQFEAEGLKKALELK